ncbi:MAG: DUF2059 domain-containing protein [Bosea sp. (in: a-proteobacteria)]
MIFHKPAFALAATLLWLTPAMAQAPAAAPTAPAVAAVVPEAQLRIARELVDLTGIGRSFDGVMPDIALRIRQNFANTRPEIIKDMDDTLVALLPEIRTRRGEMVERAARTLATLFNEAELRELSAFFNTPAGKKYVNSQPEILNQIFSTMDGWIQQTSEFFLNRFREEMRKKGHTV